MDSTGKVTVLYSFTGGTDEGFAQGGVVRDSEGNLYGTTTEGYQFTGYGTVFKLDLARTLTVLHFFTNGTDGGFPFGGLIRDSQGNLFGTTGLGGDSSCGCGVVFQISLLSRLGRW